MLKSNPKTKHNKHVTKTFASIPKSSALPLQNHIWGIFLIYTITKGLCKFSRNSYSMIKNQVIALWGTFVVAPATSPLAGVLPLAQEARCGFTHSRLSFALAPASFALALCLCARLFTLASMQDHGRLRRLLDNLRRGLTLNFNYKEVNERHEESYKPEARKKQGELRIRSISDRFLRTKSFPAHPLIRKESPA